jgi:hypothetical protein
VEAQDFGNHPTKDGIIYGTIVFTQPKQKDASSPPVIKDFGYTPTFLGYYSTRKEAKKVVDQAVQRLRHHKPIHDVEVFLGEEPKPIR